VSNTTSLNYIVWSEDAETVTYKDTSFSMELRYKILSSPKSRRPRKSSEACLFCNLRTGGLVGGGLAD
jgi:hypothetical protein